MDDVLSGTPYRAIRRIGRGQMGVVYEAEHHELGHRVAVKLLARASADLAARIRVEAQVLARIRHPNLLAVVDFGVVDDRPYLVAEIVRGRTLRDLLEERGHLSVEEAADVLRDVLAGLGAVHAAGIVHRDLKPENVILDEHGSAKVLDFGLAKIFDAGADPRTPSPAVDDGDLIVGTPAYMAPEQIAGPDVDARADVYAAGAILYELLTGNRPFPDAVTSDAMMEAHARGDVVRPSKLVDLTWDVDRIVLKAMAKRPERRYQTATDFAAAIGRFSSRGPEAGMRWLQGYGSMRSNMNAFFALMAFVAVLTVSAKVIDRLFARNVAVAASLPPIPRVVVASAPATATLERAAAPPPAASASSRPSATPRVRGDGMLTKFE